MMIPLILTLLAADFPISATANSQSYPTISYANDQFNVFWIDRRNHPDLYICGARVSKDGTVLDPSAKVIWTDSAGYSCDVASDGTNFLVLFRNYC